MKFPRVRLLLLPVMLFLSIATAVWAEKKPVLPVKHPPTYYMPQLLPSIGDAAEKIQFLAPHISFGTFTGAERVNVDHNGVQMFFSASGTTVKSQYFWSWTGGYNAPVTVPYSSSASFSVLYSQINSLRYADGMVYICKTNNDCDMLTTPDVPQDHILMDALLTLTVAGGNTNVSVVDMAWETPSSKELKKLKLSDARLVTAIDPGTSADKAGIHPGDILTAMEGVPYHQNIYGEMATKCLRAHPEGCTVHIDALRDGAPMKFEVAIKPPFTQEAAQRLLANAAALAAHPVAVPSAPAPSGVKLGIKARNVNEDDARAAKLAEARGVLVESVDPGGLADTVKMQAGDILIEVNGVRAGSLDELKKLLQSGAVATISVWRAGATVKLLVPESL